jgi:hypothetical protein
MAADARRLWPLRGSALRAEHLRVTNIIYRCIYRCRHTKAALTTKFQTVPISAPPRPAIHHTS